MSSPNGYWGFLHGFQWGLGVMSTGLLLCWVGLVVTIAARGDSRLHARLIAVSGGAVVTLALLVGGWWVSRAVARAYVGDEGLRMYDREEVMRADPDRSWDEAEDSESDRIGSRIGRIWPRPDSRWITVAAFGLVALAGTGVGLLAREGVSDA